VSVPSPLQHPLRAFVSGLGGILLCCLMAAPLAANAGTGAAAARLTAAAEKVQQQVQAIDAKAATQTPFRERPVQGLSAEGARVVAWGKPGAIEKISVEALGERGRVLQDFYWQRGALIAAQVRRIDYGANIMDLPKDKPTPTTVAEQDWLEFAGDRVLRGRSLAGEGLMDSAAARKLAPKLKADARSFKRLIAAPESPAAGSCTWTCVREQRDECLVYKCR
jgi:hypothetical protein